MGERVAAELGERMERESGGKRVEVDMADKGDERVWRESLVKKKKWGERLGRKSWVRGVG